MPQSVSGGNLVSSNRWGSSRWEELLLQLVARIAYAETMNPVI